ncbi:hypothetical protein [Candidatus Electronema sp. JC]|uniref:hypothetical protein n=1 Tax=Candidatus Electronema sp. JC TaxID=3401570 RepID=UPI003B4312FE
MGAVVRMWRIDGRAPGAALRAGEWNSFGVFLAPGCTPKGQDSSAQGNALGRVGV